MCPRVLTTGFIIQAGAVLARCKFKKSRSPTKVVNRLEKAVNLRKYRNWNSWSNCQGLALGSGYLFLGPEDILTVVVSAPCTIWGGPLQASFLPEGSCHPCKPPWALLLCHRAVKQKARELLSGDVLAWCSQLLSHRELKGQVKEIDKKFLVKVKCEELLQEQGKERETKEISRAQRCGSIHCWRGWGSLYSGPQRSRSGSLKLQEGTGRILANS